MKLGIDWTQPSTMRGMVWGITAIIGVVLIVMGKDPSSLIVLAMGVAGGRGVAVTEKD